MKTVAVVQARTGSHRLPEKVLMDIGGSPMVVHVLRRLAGAQRIGEIVLATSAESRDDPLADLARAEGVRCFRGSESDVLARFHGAALEAGADVTVRITADCPLIDPQIVDRVVEELISRRGECDWAANTIRRTYPKGLDVEALFGDTLTRIERLAASKEAREHVTWFAYQERPDLFLVHSVELSEDFSELNWSVDTEADLAKVRGIFARLGPANRLASWRDVLAHTDYHLQP